MNSLCVLDILFESRICFSYFPSLILSHFDDLFLFPSATVPRTNLEGRREITAVHILCEAGQQLGFTENSPHSHLPTAPLGNCSLLKPQYFLLSGAPLSSSPPICSPRLSLTFTHTGLVSYLLSLPCPLLGFSVLCCACFVWLSEIEVRLPHVCSLALSTLVTAVQLRWTCPVRSLPRGDRFICERVVLDFCAGLVKLR